MIYHTYTWELGGSFQKYNQNSTVSLLKLLSRSTSAIWSFEPVFHSSLSHWGTFSQVLLPCGFTIRSTRAFAALRRLNFRGSAIGHWTCKIKFVWNTGTEDGGNNHMAKPIDTLQLVGVKDKPSKFPENQAWRRVKPPISLGPGTARTPSGLAEAAVAEVFFDCWLGGLLWFTRLHRNIWLAFTLPRTTHWRSISISFANRCCNRCCWVLFNLGGLTGRDETYKPTEYMHGIYIILI